MASVNMSALKGGIRDILTAMSPTVGVVYAYIPDIHDYAGFLSVFQTSVNSTATILMVQCRRADVTWGDATPRAVFQKNYHLEVAIIRLDEEGATALADFEALIDRILDELNRDDYTEAGLVGAEGIRVGTWSAPSVTEGEVMGEEGWHAYLATLEAAVENQPIDA